MKPRAATRLAWNLWTLTFVLFLMGISTPSNEAGDASTVVVLVTVVVFILSFATVGALLASRRPDNPIGWVMSGAALCYAIGGFADSYAYGRAVDNPDLFGAAYVASVNEWVWLVGIGLAGTFLFLLFPDGHFLSSRWRFVGWTSGIGMGMFAIGLTIKPGPFEDLPFENPFGIEGAAAVSGFLAGLGLGLLLVSLVASVASLGFRYRRADGRQRQQLKWLLYAGLLVVLGGMTSMLMAALWGSGDTATNLSNAAVSIPVAFIPVAIGIAILKHRLYDIDIIINRTLVYGVLTALLVLVYVVGVVGLGAALRELTGQQSNSLAVAASTLAVAALFRPARARIQAFIDRRFYRAKYDAAKTLDTFTARLRDEVDLDELSAHLLWAITDTMHPAHASLWLRQGAGR